MVSTDHMIYLHESPVHKVLVGILYGYKGIIQLIALIMAFRTRDIKVKGLDDAKYIISTVYITTVGIVITTVTLYVLREYLNISTATLTLTIFFSTTVILGLVFIPKVCIPHGLNTYLSRSLYVGVSTICQHNFGNNRPILHNRHYF